MLTWKPLGSDQVLKDLEGGGCEEVNGVRIAEHHGQVAQHLLLATLDAVKEGLDLAGPLHVHRPLADASVHAPSELVTGIHVRNFLHFRLVECHE